MAEFKTVLPIIQSNKNILIFDHNLGGGANFYLQKEIPKFTKNNILVYRFYYDHKTQKYVCASILKDQNLSIQFNTATEALNYIELNKTKKIIVNELVSYPNISALLETIINLKITRQIDLDFLVHDYYAICPNFTLFDVNEQHCNVPDLKKCKECLPKIKFDPGLSIDNKSSVKLWRKEWLELLMQCNQIICFSQNSKKILLKAYPKLGYKTIPVIPHLVDYIKPIEIKKLDPEFRIAVLGNIFNKSKGAKILKEIAQMLDSYQEIKFYIIGGILPEFKTKNMIEIGEYQQNNLTKLIQDLNIDLVFIPSIWAETFSYTTNEAINLGLDVLVFDIGAQSEYVKLYKNGHIIEKLNSNIAVKKILKIYDSKKTIKTKKD